VVEEIMGAGQNGETPYNKELDEIREEAPVYRPTLPKKASKECLELIEHFEGFYPQAYLDPVGIPTIGIGTIKYPNGEKVKLGESCTREQAFDWLMWELSEKTSEVNEMVKAEITQAQFDALLSFAYNCGTNALRNSTLLKKLNAGDYNGAADQFLRWDKAGGASLPGLTRRRKAEREMFLGGDWRVFKT
jgi:lysozyme